VSSLEDIKPAEKLSCIKARLHALPQRANNDLGFLVPEEPVFAGAKVPNRRARTRNGNWQLATGY
jgi:hypothetical protein